MRTYHLAVDLGATSGRTILATFDGNKVVMEEMTRFKYPMMPLNGHLFWNLPFLYQEILKGIRKCADVVASKGEGVKLASIGIDTWGCDVAYFYKDGSLAGLPYCYRDSHTDGAADRFCEKMPREGIYGKTGIQFMDFNTLFQLDTIKRENPALIENSDKILFVSDALEIGRAHV